MVVEPLDVGVSLEEPDQLADYSTSEDLLRRHKRKPLVQIEAHLVTEDTECASTGAVTLLNPFVENFTHKV